MPDAPIVLSANGIHLEILRRGATIRRLDVTDASGTVRNIVLGACHVADYGASSGYQGASIGRVANRIGGGRFTLDGTEHQIALNEGANTLHGGTEGFDSRDWDVLDWNATEQAHDAVTLQLLSPDGDQGFPGTLTAQVRYAVTDGDVSITYTATTDAPTVCNLTNHAYLNLDGEGAGTILAHTLRLAADAWTPTGGDLIPTGEIRPVADSFDWRTERPIGANLDLSDPDIVAASGGLDHNFVLQGNGFREVASLHSPASGLRLDLLTDQPGVQIYTGNQLDGTLIGTGGAAYEPHFGIAMETQSFPDSPNHAGFSDITLRPGQTYRNATTWRFTRG